MLNTPHPFSPAELSDLVTLHERERGPDDLPIMRTMYHEDGTSEREPLPWRDAIELDDA